MSRSVRIVAAALLALSLVVNVPTASAAPADRDGRITVRDRIIQVLKKVLKPLGVAVNDDDGEYKPTPPRP